MLLEEFGFRGGLTEDQISMMHEKALHLIEQVGIRIPHKGILGLLPNT